jgi:putative phosphoesterase
MRILVFSDTHRCINGCVRILETIPDVDLVIHLGDLVQDAQDLATAFPDLHFRMVLGNNDFGYRGLYEDILEAEGFRLYLTHGHLLGVKLDTDRLVARAKELHADVVLFGHTHKSLLRQAEGITLLNPGASRDFDGSCGVIEIENGKLRCSILPM